MADTLTNNSDAQMDTETEKGRVKARQTDKFKSLNSAKPKP